MTAHGRPPTAVITGAGGFVLRSVVEALLAAGWRVIGVDRQFAPALQAAWTHPALDLVEADAAALPTFDTVDVLILGAAVTAAPAEVGLTPEAYFEQEMRLFQHGFAWAQAQRVRRVIALSSAAVYGQAEGPIDEERPPQPVGLYAVVKASVEALCHTLKVVHGRDCVAVRLSSVYGPHETASPSRPRISLIGQMVRDALTTGRVQPKEEPARDWTLASDIGRALLALMDAPHLPHALYNAASGQRATPLEIAQRLQALLPQLHIDTPSAPAAPPVQRGWLTHRRLTADTGFSAWTTLDDGLRQMLAAERQLIEERRPC
jgi:nucleoside-diphosphate-sugar epimerase